MDGGNVLEAFELLLEEIEKYSDALHRNGSEALLKGKYAIAQKAIEQASQLASFRQKVNELKKEWKQFPFLETATIKKLKPKKIKNRLGKGLRTPEEEFRKPILEALVEVGGSAPMSVVLETVGQKMSHLLKPHDYNPLSSDPHSIRWQNTAQWCRYTLVQEGLMKKDSPHGIWEITDQGREWLKK